MQKLKIIQRKQMIAKHTSSERIHLLDFSAMFKSENFCGLITFRTGSTLKRNNLLPLANSSFYNSISFSKGAEMVLEMTHKNASVSLNTHDVSKRNDNDIASFFIHVHVIQNHLLYALHWKKCFLYLCCYSE